VAGAKVADTRSEDDILGYNERGTFLRQMVVDSSAVTRSPNLPLLFKGHDFVHTDIQPVLRS
jgi:hypothetical protein